MKEVNSTNGDSESWKLIFLLTDFSFESLKVAALNQEEFRHTIWLQSTLLLFNTLLAF